MTKETLATCNREFVGRLCWAVADQFGRQLEGTEINDATMSRALGERLNVPMEMLAHALVECELDPPPSVTLGYRYSFNTTADAKRLADLISEWGSELIEDDDNGSLIPDLKGRTQGAVRKIRETAMGGRS